MVDVHGDVIAAQRIHDLTVHGLPHGIHISAAGLTHCLGPHLKADVVSLHGIVDNTLVAANVILPSVNEGVVAPVVDAHEVVPRG